MLQRLLCSVCVALATMSVCQAEDAPHSPVNGPPAKLNVTLAPHAEGGRYDRIGVQLRLQHPDLATGQTLLKMPTVLASIPTAAYIAADFNARDDKGALKLRTVDEEPTPSGRFRHYDVERATQGDVVVEYATAPRKVNAETRVGPYFDLTQQDGGMVGAGVYFFALPPDDAPRQLSLNWDLSGIPAGARAVWSHGEGQWSQIAPVEVLEYGYYAIGQLHEEPKGDPHFGLYWFNEAPFDMGRLVGQINDLHKAMATFFGDPNANYRVFMRQNPYPSNGGTSLPESFMFGWGPDWKELPKGSQQSLISHEMAHNWPTLGEDEPHAQTAWYTEGTAEYYSSTLSYRSKVIGLDRLLQITNERAADYYTNPYLQSSNEQAGAKFWSDPRSQRVPYGRGFMYLVEVDAKLRAKSNGKERVDDLVLEILNRQRKGEKAGLIAWKELVQRELGEEGLRDYEDMAAGKVIVPPSNALGPCLKPVAVNIRPFELGFDEFELTKVAGLREGTAAARAGIRNGDRIIKMSPAYKVAQHSSESQRIVLTIERDGKRSNVTYLPRGETVQGWRWKRVAGVSESNCGL